MSKVPAEKIFFLIKTLSKSEKRYFKLFAGQHILKSQSKSILLFNIIESQKIYNEEAILKNKNFSKKSFSALKSHLYNLVLKSLRNYTDNQNVETKIKGLISNVEILFSKLLYDQCFDLIKKGKALALKNEKYILLLELIKWERKLFIEYGQIKKSEENIKRLYKDEKTALKRLGIICEYADLAKKVTLKSKYGTEKRPEEYRELLALMKTPLLTDEKYADSVEAKTYYYYSHIFFYLSGGEFESAYEYSLRFMKFFNSSVGLLKEHIRTYITTISNLIFFSYEFKKYDQLTGLIHELESIPQKYFNNQVNFEIRKLIFERVSVSYMKYIQKAGLFHDKKDVFLELENKLMQFEEFMAEDFNNIVYASLSVCFYGAGDLPKSLKWINKLNRANRVQLGFQFFSKVLYLIFHFEKNNLLVMESGVTSAYRFLKIHKLGSREKSIIDFFKQVIIMKEKREIKKSANVLKEELLKSDKKKANDILLYFDFISWLDGIISGRPFAEIVKEKFKKEALS